MKNVNYISNGTTTYKIVGLPGPKGPAGERVPAGEQGPKGEPGDTTMSCALDVTKLGIEPNTDITEQMNDLIKNNYKKFYFPNGTYIISYLEFFDSLEIYGESKTDTILKRPDGFVTNVNHRRYAFMINNLTTYTEGVGHCIIENITIDGNVQNAEIYTTISDSPNITVDDKRVLNYIYSNIEVSGLDSFYIKNCFIKNSIGNGLALDGNRRNDVINCEFDYCGHCGLGWAARNGVDLKSIYFDYRDGAIPCFMYGVTTRVSGCSFKNTDDMALSLSPMQDILIENCDISGTGTSDFELWQDYEQKGFTGKTKLEIKNCTCNGNIRLGTRAHVLEKNKYKLIITDSTFNCYNEKGTIIVSNQNCTLDFILKNNEFYNQNSAVKVVGCENLIISRNIFDHCNSLAIQFQFVTNKAVIKDNTINTQKYGIYMYGINQDSYLIRNTIYNSEDSNTEQKCIYIFNPSSTNGINHKILIDKNTFKGTCGIHATETNGSYLYIITNNDFNTTNNFNYTHKTATSFIATGNILLVNKDFNVTESTKYKKIDNLIAFEQNN